METELQTKDMNEIISSVVLNGDLSKLQSSQKVKYYQHYCERLGLDPATQPFKLIKIQGKEVLYCDRSGTAQLNSLHKVSHTIIERKTENGVYTVVARACQPDGRQTESLGAVGIDGLKGNELCNAMMKAETKAKRRSTLDLLGLGILDESELETIYEKKFITPQERGDGAADGAILTEKTVETEVGQIVSEGTKPFKAPPLPESPKEAQGATVETNPPQDTPKDRSEPTEPPDAQKQESKPLTDKERAKMGLIVSKQINELSALITNQRVPAEQWKGWLLSAWKYPNIYSIKAKDYNSIFTVLKEHPDPIRDWKPLPWDDDARR